MSKVSTDQMGVVVKVRASVKMIPSVTYMTTLEVKIVITVTTTNTE